jgi:hypothetical protein
VLEIAVKRGDAFKTVAAVVLGSLAIVTFVGIVACFGFVATA